MMTRPGRAAIARLRAPGRTAEVAPWTLQRPPDPADSGGALRRWPDTLSGTGFGWKRHMRRALPIRLTALTSTLAIALALVLGGGPAQAARPAVAQPSFPIDGEIKTEGIVFFVPAATPSGAAAVGTAHNFSMRKLVEVRRGNLILGRSLRVVARTSGFLAPPGRPFNQAGASLMDDFVVYSLDEEPDGVRLLSIEPRDGVTKGTRVEILGIPTASTEDEEAVTGKVVDTSATRFDVELGAPYDLRGWGGAPVLDAKTKRVIGMLQAYFPKGSTSRVIVAPIAKVRAALEKPLDNGNGRAFASFRRQVATGGRQTGSSRKEGGKYVPSNEPLIRQQFEESTRVQLSVDYPPEGSLVGNGTCGVFVSGRAVALHGELRQFDVVLVLDTSRSTIDPTGADINGNGIVGKPYLGRIGSIFDVGSTDPGDSILAAEVAAARQLLRGLDPRSTRVSVVAFAGDPPDVQGGLFARGGRPPAITLQPLTNDYTRVEQALQSILDRDPEGSTHMAAGVDQATIELMGLRGAASRANPKAEKIVLFFTDGQPTLPYGPGFEADNVRAVLRAANRADRANIRIHSFAIGPDALEGPVATVEMAQRTDGFFTPVRHPGDLVNVVESVSFANLEGVQLKSLTTGEPADLFRTTADGSWAGFVRMESGENELEIRAVASDGREEVRKVTLTMADGAPDLPVPPELIVARNRLLEDCLQSIKEVRMSAEQERAEQVRKDLLVEIERERAQARERAAQQRKALQLEVGGDDVNP